MQNTATNPYRVPVSAYMQANNRPTHYLELWKTVQTEASTRTAHNEKLKPLPSFSVDKKNLLDVTFCILYSLLIVAQHVAGNHVPIIRS